MQHLDSAFPVQVPPRRLLTAGNLSEVFGPQGVVAPKMVLSLVNALRNGASSPTVRMSLDEWKRLFGIVYGEQLRRHQQEQARTLCHLYQVSAQTEFQDLFFAVHTYFALLVKLTAVELLNRSRTSFKSSFCDDLARHPKDKLAVALNEIENGGAYARRGVTNFLEGDFFGWYLGVFSPGLEEAIRGVAHALAEFEPATGAIAPDFGRDLLKELYQSLVPRRTRHGLGEYYTPDWLAELVLKETGYDGNPRKRFLDPACGSGTFLVLAIQAVREYCRRHRVSAKAALKSILLNIWGFDLNPLAVIAARTNYLFALGESVADLENVEIPIYLADSVLWPNHVGQRRSNAPATIGKFDFVAGNPPWIRWGYLSQEYREATLPMWREYGLFSLRGQAARLGGGEKDFSMLFTYACVDNYLKQKGILGFLITQEVLKSKGAGEGFRRFRLRDSEPFRVTKAHDLTTVQPFEGAANKTAIVVIRKGEKTTYPVPYTVWTRKKGAGRIPTDYHWERARRLLLPAHLMAEPIDNMTGSWRTMTKSQEGLASIKGPNSYVSRLGARVEPYGIFWLKLRQTLHDGNVIVANMPERGKRKMPQVEERIEADLVFPAVCGADVQRWAAVPQAHILMTQDPSTREPYPVEKMKREWPRTYSYLTQFKEALLSRGSRTIRELAERTAFYAMFAIGPYTVARYKVVWKRMASDLIAAVISQWKTPFGFRTVIPTDTTAFFAVDDEAEAHYLCAILNSRPVRDFIKSYSSAGRGFGAPSIMSHVGIPLFDKSAAAHQRLSQLSKTLHDYKASNLDQRIPELEHDLDDASSRLFEVPERPS